MNDPTDFIPMVENGKLDFLFPCGISPYVMKMKKGHIFDLLPYDERFGNSLVKTKSSQIRNSRCLCLAFTKN